MSGLRRAAAEGVGTALLLATVVGSGLMGERLAQGNDALALLANALATGFGLAALIIAFGPRAGAHFNPVVTLALAMRRDVSRNHILSYVIGPQMALRPPAAADQQVHHWVAAGDEQCGWRR